MAGQNVLHVNDGDANGGPEVDVPVLVDFAPRGAGLVSNRSAYRPARG